MNTNEKSATVDAARRADTAAAGPFPRSTAKIFGHPIHPMLIPFPIAFLIGALVTDILAPATGNPVWLEFSFCLILAGVVTGALAALAGFVDYAGDPRVRRTRAATPHMLLNVVAMALSIASLILRLGAPWEETQTPGLVLSILVVLILGVSAWLGGSLTYRHGVGVAD